MRMRTVFQSAVETGIEIHRLHRLLEKKNKKIKRLQQIIKLQNDHIDILRSGAGSTAFPNINCNVVESSHGE